jgi:hypothetical protein
LVTLAQHQRLLVPRLAAAMVQLPWVRVRVPRPVPGPGRPRLELYPLLGLGLGLGLALAQAQQFVQLAWAPLVLVLQLA